MLTQNHIKRPLSGVRAANTVREHTQLSLWESRVEDALSNFFSNLSTLQLTASPRVVVSYTAEEPNIEAFAQALLQRFSAMNFTLKLAPLSTASTLSQQLVNQSHVLVFCSPAYAVKVKNEPAIADFLEVFGQTGVNALQPLLCAGEYENTAFQIVRRHFLVRDFRPMVDAGTLVALPLWIETVLSLSGYQGLGLLPDLLNLNQTDQAEHKALYQSYYDRLERAQYEAMVDYRLARQLNESLKAHPLKTYFTHLPDSVESLQEEFLSSSALVQLWLCPTKADTGLMSLGVMLALQNRRTLVIDAAQYPGQASWNCVHLALQAAGLKRTHEAYLKEVSLVILFTGYEAMGAYDNLYIKNQLSAFKDLKIIVTCQANFFKLRGYVGCFLANASDRRAVEKIRVHQAPRFASQEAQKMALSLQTMTTSSRIEENPPVYFDARDQAMRQELRSFLGEYCETLATENIPKQVFISYAWEADKKALAHQQAYLLALSQDLKALGSSAWLDIEQMSGNIDRQMAGNIVNSQAALIIATPRYAERCVQDTNVKKEFDAIIGKTQRDHQFKAIVLKFSVVDWPWLGTHPDVCDFTAKETAYVECMAHPDEGLIVKLLNAEQEHYKSAYTHFQETLPLHVTQQLIVNQGLSDVKTYDMENRLKDYIEAYALRSESSLLADRFLLSSYFSKFFRHS